MKPTSAWKRVWLPASFRRTHWPLPNRLRSAIEMSPMMPSLDRVADAEGEINGLVLYHLDDEQHFVRRRATLLLESDALEEAQRLHALPAAFDQEGIDGVALGDPELAADNEVLGLRVADDLDALHGDARPLLDEEGDGDRAARRVAFRHRPHLGRGETLVAQRERHLLNRLVDRLLAVDAAGPDRHQVLQRLRVGAAQAALDRGGAKVKRSPSSTVKVML